MFSNKMFKVCKSCTQTNDPHFCFIIFKKKESMFFSRKKLKIFNLVIIITAEKYKTYSKTELSFWSPQISISVMDLKVSTNKDLLLSLTI